MTYLLQMHFITNHVTTSLHIFYYTKSIKGNSNSKRSTTKTKRRKLSEVFVCWLNRRSGTTKNIFLIGLLGDISDLCEEERLEPTATSTKSLRTITETNFEEMASFQIVWKRLMIHSYDVNPCVYVAPTLKERGFNESVSKTDMEENLQNGRAMHTPRRGVNRKYRQ